MRSHSGELGASSAFVLVAACSSLLAFVTAGCSSADTTNGVKSASTGAGGSSVSGTGAVPAVGAGGTAVSGVGSGGTPGAGATGVIGPTGTGGTVVTSGTGGTVVTSGAGGTVVTSGAGGTVANGGSSGSAGSGGGSGPITHGACLDMITDYTKDGPFMMTTKTMGPINFYVPSVPAGCKVPVVHLANGTGASCSVYLPSLQRLATNGFLAACYESPNTGAGDQGVQALDAALAMFPDLADMKFGSTGHSQGGQAAFTVLALAEKKYGDKMIYAGLAMEPASGFGVQPTGTTWQALYATIKSPMFMFSGLGTDGLVSQVWVQQAYDATSKTEEAYFWTASGATHIPVPNGQEEEISIPWFRWKLLGDQKACAAFKAIPMTDKVWAQVAAKNDQPCM